MCVCVCVCVCTRAHISTFQRKIEMDTDVEMDEYGKISVSLQLPKETVFVFLIFNNRLLILKFLSIYLMPVLESSVPLYMAISRNKPHENIVAT